MGLAAMREMDAAPGPDKAFLESSLLTGRYYFEYELPKTESLIRRLKSADRVTLEAGPDLFL